MPSAPPHYCAEPGCPVLVRGRSRCPHHAQAQDVRRGTAQQRGYTSAWARYSQTRLAQYPFCVGYPRGFHRTPVRATLTDHIISAKRAPERFWDTSNHQSLCHACNTRKGDQ